MNEHEREIALSVAYEMWSAGVVYIGPSSVQLLLFADRFLNRIRSDQNGSSTPPSAPNGWQLVPIEPTPEMLYASFAADKEYSARMFGSTDAVVSVGAYDHYVAMLAAAPKPEE